MLWRSKDAMAKELADSKAAAEALQKALSDLSSKVDKCPSPKELVRLRARIDGGLNALMLRVETTRWTEEVVSSSADSIHNSFLGLLDKTAVKLEERVKKLEASK